MMNDHKQLKVWQRAHALTIEVYRKSEDFPSEERFGLTSQLRRSAASIGSNLAEGCCRFSRAEFRRFVEFASGSTGELGYQLLLSRDLNYLSNADYEAFEAELEEIRKMLFGLHRYLKTQG